MQYLRVVWLIAVLGLSLAAQTVIDLGGSWERWIGDAKLDSLVVPSSYRPMGTVILRRHFMLPAFDGKRVLLRFEGIAHQGEVRIGGASIGTMGPWTPHRFDITQHVRPGENQIDVEITDWQVPLGPSAAWESYGGIIRQVSLELRPETYIDDARLDYELSPTFDAVHCRLKVFLQAYAASRGSVIAELRHGAATVSRQQITLTPAEGASTADLQWTLPAPALWSPITPNLYSLHVRYENGGEQDVWSTEVGFRKFEIQGQGFLLNGETLVLRGVCRHDLWPEQGHSLTHQQIEQDLRMIKSMGANFVRLVHYPHDPYVPVLAARLGLIVMEEPGFVWLQFREIDRDTLEMGLQTLERTVQRGWNNPAVLAAIIANESPITPEVMREAKRRVRALRPGLFVSVARVDSPEATLEAVKVLMDEGGIDFYAYHPYTYDMRDFERVATIFSGKPLVFTEWGGRAIGDSPVLMQATVREITKLIESSRLSGHAFWSWSDLPEFSREGEENKDGILVSGVVSEQREVRASIYTALTGLFRAEPRTPDPVSRVPELLPIALTPLSAKSAYLPISLQALVDSEDQRIAWNEMETVIQDFFANQGFTSRHWAQTGKQFWTWSAPQVRIGLFPFETPTRQGDTEPIVLNRSRTKVAIPVGTTADRLLVLGNVTVPDGYPVTGKLLDDVGRYTVVYADGSRETSVLRWGETVARANTIAVASRINPATVRGEQAVRFTKDVAREVYQTRLLEIRTQRKPIRTLEYEFEPKENAPVWPPRSTHHTKGPTPGPEKQSLLLFAVTAEDAGGGR